MLDINKDILEELGQKEKIKVLNKLVKGDVISISYNVVGEENKSKSIVCTFLSLEGSGLEKSINVLVKKGEDLIRLKLFIFYSCFFGIRIVK